MMDTRKLRKQRSSTFWKEYAPYLRYVASSGLFAFSFIGFIIFSHYYAQFLENLPNDFPVNWVAVACILPTMAVSPIRTYFKRADIIYLLPAETKMSPYIQRSLISSLIVQSIVTLVVWFMVWPLYRTSTGADGQIFLIIFMILIVIKGINLFGHWCEMQFQETFYRRFYMFMRWGCTAVIVYLLYTFNLAATGIFAGFILIGYILSLRLPKRHRIYWDYLIKVEKLQRARYFMFLGWFVDVPEMQNRVHMRRWLSSVVDLIPFLQKNTYKVLYSITYIRSDLFGIVMRLTIIAVVIVYFLQHELIKAGFCLFFIYLIGVQLSTLAQHHRYVIWIHVYPLPEDYRIHGVQSVIAKIHLFISFLLFIPIWFTMAEMIHALATAAMIILLYLFQQLLLRKKLKKNETM